MNTPTTAVTRSVLLAGRDFNLFANGDITIEARGKRMAIHFAQGQSLMTDNQIIDVNQGDRPEPLALPFLDALPRRDFFAGCK